MVKHLGFWVSLGSLTLALGACSAELAAPVASDEAPIIGGQPVTAGQFPSVVAIRVTIGGGLGLCTGSLIAPDVVLTAAHCVHAGTLGLGSQEQVAQSMKVAFDTQHGLFGGREVTVKSATPIPSFSQGGTPDLGIIKLNEKVTDRTPVKLNLDAAKVPLGTTLTIVGYGMSDPNNMNSSGPENVIDKTTVSCSSFGLPDNTFVCISQQDGTGICQGDSGGPSFAMIDGVQKQVAVTSVGGPNCGIAGANMRTDAGKDFLLANAPEAFCEADGTCNESCGGDPDCTPCSSNDDCDDDHVCDGNLCIPGPSTPGGAGAPCTSNDDCDSGQCGSGPGGMKCTESCDPAAPSCADGFDCLSAGGGNGACWPSDDTLDRKEGGCGCNVGAQQGGAGAAAGGLALLLLMGGVVARRRRRG